MLFGGVTWSELPISTQGQVIPNGEEFEYEGLIRSLLDEELEIKPEDDFDLDIVLETESELTVNMEQISLLDFKPEIEFTLTIDPNNTWAL